MIRAFASARTAGWVWAVGGLGCAALAYHWEGTPLGAMLGAIVLALASAGYGLAFARVVGERVSAAAAITTGLACLIVVGTIGAWLGVLTHGALVALVGLGLASLLGPPLPLEEGPTGAVRGLAIAAGLVLIGTKVVDLTPWFADGVNHTLEVKRLWDTGSIASASRQPGGLIVGQALLALGGGVGTEGAFDAGLCAAVLVLLLATEFSTRKDEGALPLLVLLVVPIVLNPEPTSLPVARWCGILFHVGAIVALDRAVRAERVGWLWAPPLLGLVALRWEFAVLAAAYALGGVWLTRARALPRQAPALGALAWIAVFVLVWRHGLGAPIAIGVAGLALLGAWIIVPLISTAPSRSVISVVMFAALAASLATPLVPRLLRGQGDVPTIWFGVTVALLALVDRSVLEGRATPRLRIGAAALILAWITSVYVLAPGFTPRQRARIAARLQDALVDLRYASIDGYAGTPSADARAVQDLTPPGAVIGVVGLSGAALDFARNPIRDVSWLQARYAPPTPARIRGLAFLLVEEVRLGEPRRHHPSPWGDAPPAPTLQVAHLLELVTTRGRWRLYRVSATQP